MKQIGDRMKKYESVSNGRLMANSPVVIRVDGRAFHTFTKHLNKPFDDHLINSMSIAAKATAEEMQGFKIGYVQSDEATFILTDYDQHETQGWFDYKINKLVSLSASLMSVHFNKAFECEQKPAVFDSRAFNIPREEVANCLLWRAKDWERNSLQMYAQSIFSHKQLHGKNKNDIHEMLHKEGMNWTTDLNNTYKNGTFLIKPANEGYILEACDIKPNYKDIQEEVERSGLV